MDRSPTSGRFLSVADPERTLRLLWRRHPTGAASVQPTGRRGPKPSTDLDQIIAAGVAVADADGLAALSMRRLAEELSMSRMAPYGHVSSREQLVELMTDDVISQVELPDPDLDWTEAVRRIADANLSLLLRHPWLVDLPPERPVLGPGVTMKYDRELAALAGLGLPDLELDLALAHVLTFVRGIAQDRVSQARLAASDQSTAEWWESYGRLLGQYATAEEYPWAARVGTAAGTEQGSAHDPDRAYTFGLDLLIAGLAARTA